MRTSSSPSLARAAIPVLLCAASCGPVQSTSIIVDAQAELAAAQTAGGEKHAPFEYVAAEEYLHKAREEQSYADFEVAVKDGKKAFTCARAARQLAEAATRSTMGVQDAKPKKTAVCRAGIDRGPGSLAASEEPAARGIPVAKANGGEPADPAAEQGEPADPTPEKGEAKKPAAKPKAAEPDDPEPEKPAPKAQPKADPQPEESLPEGDE